MEEEAAIVGTAESSVYDGIYGKQPASKLIDSLNVDGTWGSGCAHTKNDPLEWFSLELEMPKKVTRVQIARRLEHPDRGRNVRITVGPSRNYDPNEPLCLADIPELSGQPGLQDYVCTGDLQTGKFVKISRAGQLNLCEVKVFTLQGK